MGGAGGAGGGLPTDGPVSTDGPATDAGTGDAGEELGGEPVEGKPWLRLCPKADSQEKCCAFLCACLDKHCNDSPKDAPRLGGCMSMCMKLSDFRARCQVFHCFESNNPRVPQDHDSHCGHASGRVGGGSCRAIEEQK